MAPGSREPSPSVSAVPASIPRAGEVFRVRYPFVRETVTLCGDEGYYETVSWRPGVSIEACGYYGDDTDIVAHGEGEMILTVVDTFKPGRFPRRVFYTRQFVSPDGHAFGKAGLRMTTVDAFRRRAAGYQLEYDVEDMLCDSDASLAEDPKGLGGEAVAARAEGIAQTTPSENPS
jgi:hypothetical protein